MTKKALPVLLFAIVIFCLCYIQAVLNEQSRIMSETYEITVQPQQSADKLKNSTAETAGLIDGVLESSYYMSSSMELTVSGYSITLNVYGLSTDYKINNKYSVSSGLILNQAAIDAVSDKFEKSRQRFEDYYTPKYNLGYDEMLFNLDNVIPNETDNESAAAYLSINQMSQLMKKLGKNSETNVLMMKLKNYSYLESVKSELESLDLTVTTNTSAITEEADNYNIHLMYLSIIMAVGLLAVIAVRTQIDSGVMIIGYFTGVLSAISLPYLFPPAERSETVFGLSASGWFYTVIFAVTAMIITVREIMKNQMNNR